MRRYIIETLVPPAAGIACAVAFAVTAGVAPATALQAPPATPYDHAAHHLSQDSCSRLLPTITAMAQADPTAVWIWTEEPPQEAFLPWTQAEAPAPEHAPRVYAVPASAKGTPLPAWACGFESNSIHVITASSAIVDALHEAIRPIVQP